MNTFSLLWRPADGAKHNRPGTKWVWEAQPTSAAWGRLRQGQGTSLGDQECELTLHACSSHLGWVGIQAGRRES